MSIGTIALWMGAQAVGGQGDWQRAQVVVGDGVRVVAPQTVGAESVAKKELRRFVTAFEALPSPAGIPAADSDSYRPDVTISFVWEEMPAAIEGWAVPTERRIVLPLGRALEWEAATLRRVLGHEWAHIEMARFLGFVDVPEWFEEGFAEWAVGGLNCERQARFVLELQRRVASGERLPALAADIRGPRWFAYDAYTAAFEFLENVAPGVVGRGDLLRKVEEVGIHAGVVEAAQREWSSLRRDWDRYLRDLALGGLDGLRC